MFSVLLSIYHKEDPCYFEMALRSIWDDQTLKPGEIVVVKDGPLTDALDGVVERWKSKLPERVNVVSLKLNVGLAAALNKGLEYCSFDLIARMDTDDIATCDRFERQFGFMSDNPEISVCSGQIEEWDRRMKKKLAVRTLPVLHDDIKKMCSRRSPISHPAVMYRKLDVINVGGYPDIYPEDYPLWGIMMSKGYVFANLPFVILKMRTGEGLMARRGWKFYKGEVKTYLLFKRIGIINNYEFLSNVFARFVLRLSPTWMKKLMYNAFR